MSNQVRRPKAASVAMCCAPLGFEPMSERDAERLSGLLKALADPVRLQLMSMIAAADEACVCDLLGPFDLSQPTISHHLKVLREAGLVESERRATWVYYRICQDALDVVGGLFAGSAVGVGSR